MDHLRGRLPPTNALVTFEAVARHLSFTAAARELGVSQAATSRQVRLLEDHLGVRLFQREGRRIRLTAAGEQLHPAVSMAFAHIVGTTDALRRSPRGEALTVGTSIAFSAFWLMPRLAGFQAAHPGLELRLVTSDAESDLFAEDIDVVVVFGDRPPPGSEALRLFGDQVMPVCHPDYLAGRRPALKETADLLGETLLHLDSRQPTWLTWQAWLAACGTPVTRTLPGPHFSTYTITIQAARDGRGIALGWRRLIDQHLEDGSLVPVTSARHVPQESHLLLIPHRMRQAPSVHAFRDWILTEAAGDWPDG